ncbi:MAG: hypothetical protein GY922_15330 [Proteobacteria bacterium]|nr:hypothetical protein [Pseudomonadota bacterium]
MILNFTRSPSVVFDTSLLMTGGCVRQCLRVILTLILVNPIISLAFAEDSQPNYVVLPVEVRKAEVRVVEQVPPSISIPPHALAPFVGRPLLMDELSGIPYGRALIGVGGQSMWGQFNQFLATDLPASANGLYTTFRPGKEILDPASGQTLAMTAAFLGIARLDQNNDVATLTLIQSDREVMVGDRLMPFLEAPPALALTPVRSNADIDAYVVQSPGLVGGSGSYSMVVISAGLKDGIDAGDILDVFSPGRQLLLTDQTSSVIRKGSEPCQARRESLKMPGARLLGCEERAPSSRELTGRSSELIDLPEEKSGELIVYRAFDQVSFALLLEVDREIYVGDRVKAPRS